MRQIRKDKNLITLGIFFMGFFIVMTNQSITVALSEIVKDLVGVSNFLFGLMTSMVFLGNLLMIFIWVKISDIMGKKPTLIISMSVAVFGVFLQYFATRYWMYLLFQFIIGLNSVLGVISALIYDRFPEESRGIPLAVYTIGVVLGFLTGSLIGGPLYKLLERATFLVISCFIILCILTVAITIRGEERVRERDLKEERLHHFSTWKYIIQNKNIIGVLIQNFFNYICFTGGGSYAIFVIFTYLEADPTTGGLFLIPIQITEIIVFFILGKKCKNYTKVYRLMLITGFIILGFTIGLYFLTTKTFFSITLVVFGVALACSMQAADVLSHIMIPPEHKSNLVSFYRSAGLVGSIIGPAFFGMLADTIWIFAPAVFFVVGIFLITLMYDKWMKNKIELILK